MVVMELDRQSASGLKAALADRARMLAGEISGRGSMQGGWVALRLVIPRYTDILHTFSLLPKPRWFWHDRGEATAWVAAGIAAWSSISASAALDKLSEVWRHVSEAVVCGPGARLRCIIAASFTGRPGRALWAGWPGAVLWLPVVTVAEEAGDTCVIITVPVSRDSDGWRVDEAALDLAVSVVMRLSCGTVPEYDTPLPGSTQWDTRVTCWPARDEWLRAAEAARQTLAQGAFRKIVLARSVGRAFRGLWSPESALSRLQVHGEEAYVFALDTSEGCFLGATPERLCAVRGRTVHVDALAGSRPRGADTADDERLAAELLQSRKDRVEHQRVVEWIEEALAGYVPTLDRAQTPSVRRLRYIQHLYTPIRGALPDSGHLLEVARRLHPTPAVAGVPQTEALRWIADHEPFDRGLYAGPIGWTDLNGDGELAVALRSGLVRDGVAWLFAGVGLMAESDPSLEWDETRWKLQLMAQALDWPEGEVPEG